LGFGTWDFPPLLIVLIFLTSSVFAQPIPKLTAVSPDRIQRGTSAELTFAGEHLGDALQVVVHGDPGVTITLQSAPTSSAVLGIESAGGITRVPTEVNSKDAKRVAAKLIVDAGAPPGTREIRLITANGVSNPMQLSVGQLPEIAERGPNNSLEQAQMIALPAAISGSISAAAQVDYYRFKAAKGQELIFEVDAFRRGSPLDSSLAILNSKGEELDRSEDALGLDSLLAFTVPADGEYILQLRDFRYQGGGNFSYRLYAGGLPFIETMFPFGAQRGTQPGVSIRGHNLAGTTNLVLDISASAPLGRQEIRASTPNGLSNPFPFDVSEYPEFFETEPNHGDAPPNDISVPVVINGRIGAPQDVDRFKFKSDTDQKLVCEVIARRFGSPLDALLTLSDANGNILQQNDDANGADARIEFDAKRDAEYILSLRDLTRRGGDKFVYRLAVRPPAAVDSGFTARFLPDTIRVHRGGTTRVRCEVTRLPGFNGPVRFALEDLPAGVFAEPLLLPPGSTGAVMTVTASKGAAPGSFPFSVMASGTVGGKALTRAAEPLSGNQPARQAFVTVLEEAPFALELLTLSASIEQEQTATLEVLVLRRDGFEGEVKLFAEGFSAGRDPITRSFDAPEAVVKGNETIGRINLRAKVDSEIGTRTVLVRGEAVVDGNTYTQFSRPVPVTVSQLPFLLSSTMSRLSVVALPADSQSPARETATTIKLERRAGFTNEVQLSLEGLPDGFDHVLNTIPAGAGETSLTLFANEKSPSNTNFTFRVVGSSVHNDKNYRRQTGGIALSIAAPEPQETKNSAAVSAEPANQTQ
jgi:hypothetical protein